MVGADRDMQRIIRRDSGQRVGANEGLGQYHCGRVSSSNSSPASPPRRSAAASEFPAPHSSRTKREATHSKLAWRVDHHRWVESWRTRFSNEREGRAVR